MKKTAVLLICIIMLCFLQFGQDVKVNASIRTTGEDGSSEYLDITANRICIFNKEKFAEEIIRRREENSFKEIYFTDQYPDEIEVDVYSNWLTREMRHRAFSIVYEYGGEGDYSFRIE